MLEKNKYTQRIIVAGFGGQGVMMIGQIIALAGLKKNLHTLWFPSYGPETRGGTANCSVILSETEIYSPVSSKIDILIALNGPSLNKFIDKVKDDGIIIYNSSLIDYSVETQASLIPLPLNDLVTKIGNPRVSNMIIVGAYLGLSELLDDTVINEALIEYLGEEKMDLLKFNQLAILLGYNYVNEEFKNDEQSL